MINLKQHFIEFAKKLTSQSKSFDLSDDKVLHKLLALYNATPFDEFEGKTPIDFVNSLTPTLLIEALKLGETQHLMQKISQTKECALLLNKLVSDLSIQIKPDEDLLFLLVDLLSQIDENEPLDSYVALLNKRISSNLKEEIIQRLKLNADKVRELLLNNLNDKSLEYQTIVAEILLCAKRDVKTFDLLIKLFLSGQNNALYASYLGKYGDEKAAAYLYPALDKADYVDFLEIKNAIERLGGIVDDNLRDFTLDPLYHIVKGQKPIK